MDRSQKLDLISDAGLPENNKIINIVILGGITNDKNQNKARIIHHR